MAKTQGERLEDLSKRVDQLTITAERASAVSEVEVRQLREANRDLQAAVNQLQDSRQQLLQQNASQEERIKALEKSSDPAALASHDQRLKALEKGTDRLWQFAPMVISVFALLAVIVFGVLNATRK